MQGIRIVPYTRGDLRKRQQDDTCPLSRKELTMDRPIPQTGEFWLLKNQHLAKIVACPVEMVPKTARFAVYIIDYNSEPSDGKQVEALWKAPIGCMIIS